jgi:TMEM175 potassium channel family protein
MAEPDTDLFEMRRLESLSNTIFGVAMTLLAYDLPKVAEFKTTNPDWSDLGHLYSGKLAALILSFVIAGVFWISHHRRLVRQPEAGRGVVLLNLFFLLSIILLPVTNGLYSNYRLSSAVSVLYGLHLTVIAGLNAWLWCLAVPGARRHEIAGAVFPMLVLLPGIVVAAIAPEYAQYVWFLAFGGFLMRRFFKPEVANDT